MPLWLVSAGLLPLLSAAAVANAQVLLNSRDAQAVHSKARTLNLRISQTYQFEPFVRSEKGIIAETDVTPNARVGLGMVAITARRPGPTSRFDGRPDHSRKPAVTVVWKF
jgi:hypothetical protein